MDHELASARAPRLDGLRHVLCEPARLALLGALESEPLTVGELATAIGRKLPATSQHLRVLRQLNLVTGDRQGTTVYYRLAPGPLSDQVRALIAALEVDDLTRGTTVNDAPAAPLAAHGDQA